MTTDAQTRTITVGDGKYTYTMKGPELTCQRYGEKWRDFVGDHAVHLLFEHAFELEEKNRQLQQKLDKVVRLAKTARDVIDNLK